VEIRETEIMIGPAIGAGSAAGGGSTALGTAVAGGGLKALGTAVSGGGLKAFSFDATDCPDLFPPLVALASYCSGVTTIRGVSRLAHKESNRGLTLQDEFGKMGVTIELDGDLMRVYGGGVLQGATVHSRHDHRIAMACAVAALKAAGPVTIEDAEAIDKSYPDFYGDLQKLGANVNIQQ
jgi:3-phosphoshikimate 1-carboxyvinyltransferase